MNLGEELLGAGHNTASLGLDGTENYIVGLFPALQTVGFSLAVARRGWLVGCFGFNGPLRQYFSLYRAVSQREGERGEKG